MKRIILFLLVLFVCVSIWAENSSGARVMTRASYTGEKLATAIDFLPYWSFSLDEDEQHNLMFALRTTIDTEYDELLVTPEFNFLLFNNLLVFGGSFPTGVELSEDESPEPISYNRFWVDLGRSWKYVSFDARAEYELNTPYWPEMSFIGSSRLHLHLRDGDHSYPYPWTITFGPEGSWVRTIDTSYGYERDQVHLSGRLEFQGLHQSEDDEFPRSWDPRLALVFINRLDRQEYDDFSYDWVYDPRLKVEMAFQPSETVGFSLYTNFPLVETENEIYNQNGFSAGAMVQLQLY